jgi:hypothetical protein
MPPSWPTSLLALEREIQTAAPQLFAPPPPPSPAQFEHLIVNSSMLEGAQLAERELQASLESKQAQLAGSRWGWAGSSDSGSIIVRGGSRCAGKLMLTRTCLFACW